MFLYFSVTQVFFLCLLSCNAHEKPEATTAKVDSLAAFTVKKQAIQRQLQLSAELLPLEKAEIVGKMQGYIRRINVDIGDRVKKGNVLVLIDAPEMLANLNQAKARLGEAKAKYNNSNEYYQRIYKASQVQGTVSKNELTQAYTQMQADSASVFAANANISTYAALNNYLAIIAPFSGIVTQRNADVGNFITANNSEPILILENNSQLRLRIDVPEQYANAALNNKTLNFNPQTEADKSFQATFSRRSGSIDPTTRSETWEFLYNNNKMDLKSGMYVSVNVDFGKSENGLAVPSSAIVANLEKKYVIAFRNGKTIQIPIQTGFKMKEQTEIFGDINEGDTLLVKPNDEIKDGSNIVIQLQ